MLSAVIDCEYMCRVEFLIRLFTSFRFFIKALFGARRFFLLNDFLITLCVSVTTRALHFLADGGFAEARD